MRAPRPSGATASHAAEDDSEADHDERDRPQVTPRDGRHVQPEGDVGEEPQPNAEDDQAPDAPRGIRRADDFGKRVEEGAEAFGRRAEALGHEAEAAAQRWSSSPAVKETADAAGRLWGLVVLAVGIWFFADITLGLRMPSVAWRDLWPLVLIAFGGFIVLKGMTRRT